MKEGTTNRNQEAAYTLSSWGLRCRPSLRKEPFMLRFLLPRALALACFLACLAYVFRPASAEGPKLSPVVERTLAEVGRTRVIAFRVAAPAAEDASFEATV